MEEELSEEPLEGQTRWNWDVPYRIEAYYQGEWIPLDNYLLIVASTKQ